MRGDPVSGESETVQEAVEVINAGAKAPVVLVCEHAARDIPSHFEGLGLDAAALESHVAWDPGALSVARQMSDELDAVLVAGRVSRLVYDCNRPPDAPGAMPAQSEIFAIPGNAELDDSARAARVTRYYEPFRATLAATIKRVDAPVIVTVHSFTPIYHGRPRAVEIGVLHDSDTRLADAMLATAEEHTDLKVLRNAPYGPQDGVTHTLKEHGLVHGHPHVMLEIRNDLIATEAEQQQMGAMISTWLRAALERPEMNDAMKDAKR
ncbi:N-formylglutamate amidohydrolase [Sulfitobacter sp. PS-8MA]|uniref:N-formylglutamate amidohydrolase n=1 Tax=Sulfitobacter sp. PS-8MA TaxID=3237707 RepID=UPI0034C61812